MTTTHLTEHTVTVDGQADLRRRNRHRPAVVHAARRRARRIRACPTTRATSTRWPQHFRVIVPDMPGYGRSAKGVDHSDPFGYLADMIRGLLDELGIDTAHLVGNSYGGAAALRLALDTPHRVDRLVLMGPGGIGTTRGAADRRV